MNQLPDTTEVVLKAVILAAAPVFTENFSPDCCLNGTRVILSVLDGFGVRARPLSMKTYAANRVYVDRVRRGLHPLADPAAWALGVDTTDQSGSSGWPGHLVALVDEKWIFDSSSGQFDRPEKNIHVPQMFLAKWPKASKGKKITHREYELDDGGVLAYRSRPHDMSFKSTPGFQLHDGNLEVVAKVLQNAHRILEEAQRKLSETRA